MILRQRLENLPVGRKLLLALLVLLAAVLLVSNLTFISAAYWISRQSVAPQAMHTLGELFATEELSARALSSPEAASKLLKRLDGYAPLRAAMIYDQDGNSLAQLQQGDRLRLPEQLSDVEHWRASEIRANLLVRLPQADGSAGHLLMVASSELPGAFYTGTLTASLAILVASLLLWILVARQIRQLITRPIRDLEALSRQVTREEDYSLRAKPGNQDEIGRLADAFNTMLSRMEAREQQLKRARDDAQEAFDHAQGLAEETRHSNRKLELEVQVRSKIEQKLTGFQKYLNSIIDSMPSALIALDEQLYVTQWNQEASAAGRRPQPAGVRRLRAAQAVSRADPAHFGTARGGEDRAGDLDAQRRAAPLCADLLSADRRWRPRCGDPHRRHHPAHQHGRNDGAVGEDALGGQPRGRHGPRDQQPPRRHPAQRTEHPPPALARTRAQS
jgi:PAS domain-containing protein